MLIRKDDIGSALTICVRSRMLYRVGNGDTGSGMVIQGREW